MVVYFDANWKEVKMFRTTFTVGSILLLVMTGSYGAFSHVDPMHSHWTDRIVKHSGPTDAKGCHEDGSGGYHCH